MAVLPLNPAEKPRFCETTEPVVGCADANADAGDRAGKGQVSSDAEIFSCLIEPAKAVPGIDNEVMRAIRDAALKQT